MKGKKTDLKRGLAVLLTSIFVLSLFVTSLAGTYESTINSKLGTSSYKTEKTGESSSGNYFLSAYTDLKEVVDAKEALAIEIAQEGTVLFKNDGSLPLAASEKVTIWGLNSVFPTYGGLIGSTVGVNSGKGQQTVSLIDAMKARGFSVNDEMIQLYLSDAAAAHYRKAAFFGQEVPGHSLSPVFWPMYEGATEYAVGELPAGEYTDAALNAAKDTAAIVFISRDSSEASDYALSMKATNGDSFERPLALSSYERDMIELAKANSNGKVIVVLNSDMTMEIEELKQDSGISAIVWAGLPGAYGFYGVADVLSGAVNPSGHIADTYAVSSISAPAMQNFGIFTFANASITGAGVLGENDRADWYDVESEGIYVGYKYYETRYEDAVLGRAGADSNAGVFASSGTWNYAEEMSYPFGYGKSYTTFRQELLNVEFNVGGDSHATVRVTNTGSVAGKDVVQLYAQAPYTEGGLEKAAIQLVGFGKTGILEPGASAEVTVTFDAKYVASYDENAVKTDGTAGAWVLDAGDYYFSIGNGAHEAINNILAAKLGTTDGLIKVNDDEIIDAENAEKVTLAGRDIETYSQNVENALQSGDINKFTPGAVEYFTRSDWTKGWSAAVGLTATNEMLKGLTNHNYEMTANGDGETWGAAHGLVLADALILDDEGHIEGIADISDPIWDQLVEEVTLEEAVSYLKISANMEFRFQALGTVFKVKDGPIGFVNDQVPNYAANWDESQSDEPTYVSADNAYGEWCMATMPTEPMVAATFNAELVEREGEIFGEDSLWSNVNAAMGPGLNLHRATYCSRNHEYYSEDPMLTNIMGVAVCTGAQAKGMIMEPKHFCLNHQEANRAGVATFNTEQGIREGELRGFQGCLETNLARGVMTAFNRIGTVYAGAHYGLVTQILRNEWGFTGFIISDAVNGPEYMNWRDINFAGGGGCLTTDAFETSVIGVPESPENLAMIQQDTAFQQALKKSIKYVLYALADSNTMNGITSDTRFVRVHPWWEIALYAFEGVSGVLAVGSCILYASSCLRKKNKEV